MIVIAHSFSNATQ